MEIHEVHIFQHDFWYFFTFVYQSYLNEYEVSEKSEKTLTEQLLKQNLITRINISWMLVTDEYFTPTAKRVL